MAKVLVVTSGKGGVGKTTSTAALGAALAQSGESVVVIDFDVGLRNLDLVMGAERRVVFDLINVVHGVAKLQQALIRDKRLENLWLLPASQTRDKDALTDEGVGRIIAELRTKFDWILCDSPAGIERGAMLAMRYADEAVIVTNPEVSSVRDSDRIIGMLDSKTVKAEQGERVTKHVLITRYDPARAARGEMLSIDDILEILATPLLGIIPESQDVLRASNVGSPVTLNNAASAPARLCRRGPPADGRNRRHDRAGRTQGPDEPVARTEGRMNMNLLRLFNGRKASAPVARERLQILLAHERGLRGQPDLLATLREEILTVVSRHIQLDPEKVTVRLDRGPTVSTLEVDIEVPNGFEQAKVRAGRRSGVG
jgi:septum site-determining protein MinD